MDCENCRCGEDMKVVIAKPFVKWAGGKTQLLTEIREKYPFGRGLGITKYAEPFVGGGNTRTGLIFEGKTDWFKKPEYKDVLDYIHSVKCHYYFEYIPLYKLGLPLPSEGSQ